MDKNVRADSSKFKQSLATYKVDQPFWLMDLM